MCVIITQKDHKQTKPEIQISEGPKPKVKSGLVR